MSSCCGGGFIKAKKEKGWVCALCGELCEVESFDSERSLKKLKLAEKIK